MEFYCHMYFSEDLRNKKTRIIRGFKQNRLRPDLYLITLAQGSQNQLEFFSGLLLKQKIFRTEDLFVVGVASGYDEALYLTEEIVGEVCKKTKTAKVRQYILQEQAAYMEGKG